MSAIKVWHESCIIYDESSTYQKYLDELSIRRKKLLTTKMIGDKIMRRMHGNLWLPDLFNDLMSVDFPAPKLNRTAPAINVKESDKAYIVELAAPGLKKEDFFVHINDEGNLTIKMEQKEDKKEENESIHYLRREFSYTKYEQTLILPDDVDKEKIGAKVCDGILTINLPKIEETKVKVSRQIAID